MNGDVFRAILAMDSYNRGYAEGLFGLSPAIGTRIGNAVIIEDALDPDGVSKAASFYAIGYDLNGETIISYRGTDDPNGISSLFYDGDILNGWLVGAGSPIETQAKLAVEFYNSLVAQGVDPRAANIALTGHSLGAGLGGYVASLYGRLAHIYRHVSFGTERWLLRVCCRGRLVGQERIPPLLRTLLTVEKRTLARQPMVGTGALIAAR